MAMSLNKESYLWHKLHSLSGIVPVGFYMLQHLTLNSFSIAGPRYFNGVIGFFESMPKHLLLAMEVALIWVPLAFHAVYGLFIVNRGEPNYVGTKYRWSQNRMYTLQRYSGIFLLFFLIYHVITTTGAKYAQGVESVHYAAMQEHFRSFYGIWTLVYALGVLAASYHLCYGIWNFCIRWGITISEQAQARVQRFSFWMFIAVTLLGWAAIAGFFMHEPVSRVEASRESAPLISARR